MTTARTVPVTTEMDGDELDVEDAWRVARRVGLRRLAVDAFRPVPVRRRVHPQPSARAAVGAGGGALPARAERPRRGHRPRAAGAVTGTSSPEDAGQLALSLGLAVALLSMTVAMSQLERGLNRVYGIRRDRPALAKYGRSGCCSSSSRSRRSSTTPRGVGSRR